MAKNTEEIGSDAATAAANNDITNSRTNNFSNAFPSLLGRVHSLRKTPWIAIIIAMICAMLTVGFSLGDISGIANISVFGIFLVFVAVNLCLIWYRFKKPSAKRPFLSPLNRKISSTAAIVVKGGFFVLVLSRKKLFG